MDTERLFNALTEEMIRDYVAQQQQEGLHLDFKLANDHALSSRDDRKNLAKALSGFANSSGGLIVWGVDARKNAEGLDAAVGLLEIEAVATFVGRLNALTGEAVEPSVPGCQHRAILSRDGKGYAVTLIPESDSGPHMAKLGEDRYYKRSGDSFYRMEHFDIADMFGKRHKPKLVLVATPRGAGVDAEIVISLRNEGRASAHAPYLAFGCNPPFVRSAYGLDGNHNEGLPRVRSVQHRFPWRFGADASVTIHPGIQHDITKLIRTDRRDAAPINNDVVIEFCISSADQRLVEGEYVVSREAFQ